MARLRSAQAAVASSRAAQLPTLGTTGSFGPDRITRNSYDGAGQLLKVQKAYGITIANGAISRSDIAGDLAGLCRDYSREAPGDVTVFKSVGTALEDYAGARLAASAPLA